MNLFLRSSLLAVSLRGISGFVAPRTSTTTFVARTMSSLNAKPFAVIVQAEIQAERIDEFVKLIEENAVNTRKEPGCLRFGKLLSREICVRVRVRHVVIIQFLAFTLTFFVLPIFHSITTHPYKMMTV